MALTAWRAWVAREGRLHSLFVDHTRPWPTDGPLEARCLRMAPRYYFDAQTQRTTTRSYSAHDVPDMDCNCGIYATLELGFLAGTVHSPSMQNGGVVLGACKLWGRVIPYPFGYVAEFCKPTGLFAGPLPFGRERPWADPALVRACAAAYGVPTLDPEEAATWVTL